MSSRERRDRSWRGGGRPLPLSALLTACAAVALAACSPASSPRPESLDGSASTGAGGSLGSASGGVAEEVSATVETEPVPHGGDAADDPAVWVNPDDPARSAIIGTD